MTVKELIKQYAKENGFDGLVHDWGECGCEIDDLCPCELSDLADCAFGYKVPCDCGDGCAFHIALTKPVPVLNDPDKIAEQMYPRCAGGQCE